MPGTAALVILALVTMPSGSLALTPVEATVPWTVFKEAAQLGIIAWLGGPLDGARATPRKALFVPAVAIVVGLPEIVTLYPVLSMSLKRVVPVLPEVPNNVTVVP